MTSTATSTVPKILVVGGGYAGFYTAWKLEKHLRKGEAEVTIVDPLPYMTYQPFLPEVAAGGIEARHAVVALRRHLKRTTVFTAKVTGIDHANRVATITPALGEPWQQEYDQIVVTAGAVSRTFPIPGIADNAIGMKTIEEAVAVRDRLMSNFDKAATLPPGPERDRLLTVVVVGGGFAGIEVFAELRSLASALVHRYPTLTFEDTHFHLIEAMGRIMPEVSLKTSEWVLKDLAKRGAFVHLDTQVKGAVDGNVELSTGEIIPTDLIIWTAGVMANPEVVRGSDLPIEERGRILTRSDLRVGTADDLVHGAWAAGDVSAVPDLSGGGVGGYCVPNAQHAVRQAKLMAKNVTAVLRDELPHDYYHKNLGVVAALGLYDGVFQSNKIVLKGLLAWFAHRGYHGLAMPSWERKFRVFGGWWNNFWLGRDLVNLETVQNPRYVFEEFAARPRAAQPAAALESSAPTTAAPSIDGRSGDADLDAKGGVDVAPNPAAVNAAPATPGTESAAPLAPPAADSPAAVPIGEKQPVGKVAS